MLNNSRKGYKEFAKKSLKGKWFLCILLVIFTVILNYFGINIGYADPSDVNTIYISILGFKCNMILVAALLTLIYLFVVGPLLMGVAKCYMEIVSQRGKLSDIIKPFKVSYLRNVKVFTIQFLINAVIIMAIVGAIKQVPLLMVLVIFISIYISIKLFPLFFIALDNPEMDSVTVLKTTWKMTENHVYDILVLQLSFIPWILLVSVTLGLAAFYVEPYYEATFVSYYFDLVEEMKS